MGGDYRNWNRPTKGKLCGTGKQKSKKFSKLTTKP